MASNRRNGYGKLLDYWMPIKDAGEAIGCLATTYTFDPELFEEECLSRFLKMDTEFDEDGALYLIEREEKLCAIKCASILVDQSHSDKKRSLRWDMLSMRYNGKFHPKISVLYWSGLIRIIVASANLSKPGYRENQEIFGVIDFILDSGKIVDPNAPVHILKTIVDFLRQIINDYSLSGFLVNNRSLDFLQSIKKIANQLTPINGKPAKNGIYLDTILIAPGRKNIFEQLENLWIKYSNKLPRTAWITSPFYDPPDSDNQPAKQIWTILNKKGDVEVNYSCPFELSTQEDKKFLIMAPESLKINELLGRPLRNVNFWGISIHAKDENGSECIRPIHLKNIFLENIDWALYMIGSSNFTTPGTGLGRLNNFEANLVYIVNKSKNPDGYKLLKSSFLVEEYLDPQEIEFGRTYSSEDDSDPTAPNLPLFFKGCEAVWEYGILIRFHFDKDKPIRNFRICDESGSLIFDKSHWCHIKEPEFYRFPWAEKLLPSGFHVYLEDSLIPAYWPLNAEDGKVLPTPDELKNLKLSELIEILCSSKSLIWTMRKILKEKSLKSESDEKDREYIDPHKRVNTSGYILQRTRRMSSALHALSERLSRPVYTKESLDWRLYGPVGVKALCNAMVKEVEKTHLEKGVKKEELLFFLTELAIEIGNIDPTISDNSLTKKEINDELKRFLKDLYSTNISLINAKTNSPIRKYAQKAFTAIKLM